MAFRLCQGHMQWPNPEAVKVAVNVTDGCTDYNWLNQKYQAAWATVLYWWEHGIVATNTYSNMPPPSASTIQRNERVSIPESHLRQAKYNFRIKVLKIDAMSRADMFKYFTRTSSLIKEYGECHLPGQTHCSFVFNNYGGAHGHTMQSLMAAFAGQKADLVNTDLHEKCGGRFPEPEKTEFIWEYARRYGYKSQYAAVGNMFMGGSDQPRNEGVLAIFDYPGSSMHVPDFGTFDWSEGPGAFCVDGKSPAGYMCDYLTSLRAMNHKRTISIANFLDAHTRPTRQSAADAHIESYLRELLRSDPNSVVVVMTDHGQGRDPQGALRPLLSLLIPKWFLEEHHDIYEILIDNQERFVNHYSLFHTIKSFIHFGSDLADTELTTATENTPKGTRSLLEPANQNMTCDDLWLPEEWCPCVTWTTVDTSTQDSLQLIRRILDEVNSENSKLKGTTCMPLTVNEILGMRHHHKSGHGDATDGTYKAKFNTNEDPEMSFSVVFHRYEAEVPAMKIMSFKMLDSYNHFRVCRDNRINPNKCVFSR